jgi:hypothetical protein
MNPTVPQAVIDEAMEADPASAAAEYIAEWRTDVETFVARAVVEAAVLPGRFELPRVEGVRYWGFVDPSGGSSDSMTAAVVHMQGNTTVIVDALRERRPPFSPDDVVSEFCATLRSYGITRVHGDRFAGEWPRERFRVHGIEYAVAAKPKSDLYRDLLPLLNAGRVELLAQKRLVAQLCSLERRTARGGRDSIDHAPGAHDDVANAAAGAAVLAAQAAALSQAADRVAGVSLPRNGLDRRRCGARDRQIDHTSVLRLGERRRRLTLAGQRPARMVRKGTGVETRLQRRVKIQI